MSGLNIWLISFLFAAVIVSTSGVKFSTCANELCMNNGECRVKSDNTYECLCSNEYTGGNCQTMTRKNRALENRTLSITVKTTLYDLYIDGEKRNLTYPSNWTKPDLISLSPLARLISIMAIDSTESCAGVIGSVTDDYLVTDNISWICHYIPDLEWYTLGFEDSSWPPAYIVGPNHNVTEPEECKILIGIPSISPNAYWIWTDTIPDTPLYHPTIYCRGYLPLCERDTPCRNGGSCNKNNQTLCSCLLGFIGEFCETVDIKDVTITAKDELYAAYVDGAPSYLPNGDIWQQTDVLRVNSISRLLAVMAIKLDGTCPGILAYVNDSVGEYVFTNATWKCSPSAMVGWSELGYDDSAWPNAEIIHQNAKINDTDCHDQFIEIPSISSKAYWIWTNTSVRQDVVVYCRGYLPICNVHPCKNGGICNRNSVNLCTCPVNYTGKYCENEIEAPDNTTVSSDDDVIHAQKLGDTDDIDLKQAPNPVPLPSSGQSPNPVAPSVPQPEPIQKSDDTVSGTARKAFIKQHNG